MNDPQHFVFALVEDFTHIAFACAVDPLRIANLVAGRALYRWSFASENGETARGSDEAVVLVHHRFDALPRADRIFVLSGIHMLKGEHAVLIAALRRQARTGGAKIGALCSGAWILAKAGLLDGEKTAIHWEYHDAFMEAFPQVPLVRNVFVADARHVTASGGTATADLMLHLIGRDHGEDLATAVADQMVYNAVREASAAQKVSLQSRNGMRNAHLAAALEIMGAEFETPPTPAQIAHRLGISVRHLERLFGRYLNTTPKKYAMELRLERARRLLLQTEMSVTEIAMACGFRSAGHFSGLYRTAYGVTPSTQRRTIS